MNEFVYRIYYRVYQNTSRALWHIKFAGARCLYQNQHGMRAKLPVRFLLFNKFIGHLTASVTPQCAVTPLFRP